MDAELDTWEHKANLMCFFPSLLQATCACHAPHKMAGPGF